ncbi:MAG: tyrosine-type recombinase/integrase [Bryobacteraceae bacterium]
MPLSLHRRHTLDCAGGHQPRSRSYEHDEKRRAWRECQCPIYASGTLSGSFRRKDTRQFEWKEAKGIAAEWEAARRWDSGLPPPRPPDAPIPQPESTGDVTIERAVQAFLAEYDGAAPSTRRKYFYLLNKFLAYSLDKGYRMLHQWRTVDVREFRGTWGVKPRTANKDMSTIRAFFGFAVANEWITRNPADLVKNPRGRTASDRRNEQKYPFDDDELQRMLNACPQYGKTAIRWDRLNHGRPAVGQTVNYRYSWTGEDLADFIQLSAYTGLRISDIATFHIDRLQDSGEVFLFASKNGEPVNTWIPEWLQQRVRMRAEKFGPLIFGAHTTTDINVITDVWRRKLNRLWELCGPWKEKPTPHRFRHTFARILLQTPGITTKDVAELLGDTEQMVCKHYAAWVPERQARLTNAVRRALDGRSDRLTLIRGGKAQVAG